MYYVEGKYKFNDTPHYQMWFYGADKKRAYYCTDGFKERSAKLYFKPQTGWDFEKYGLYFYAIFPDGGTKRIYLNNLVEYR